MKCWKSHLFTSLKLNLLCPSLPGHWKLSLSLWLCSLPTAPSWLAAYSSVLSPRVSELHHSMCLLSASQPAQITPLSSCSEFKNSHLSHPESEPLPLLQHKACISLLKKPGITTFNGPVTLKLFSPTAHLPNLRPLEIKRKP